MSQTRLVDKIKRWV